ncbi:MAG: hypothetical protein VX284_01035 [Candidatus Neomarinimicrobiota bacterium]|nr:hypothetical protein [Candidatus Neomarinimicrobiota bacterium]
MNSTIEHHFAPYPGHSSAANFIDFYDDPITYFLSELQQIYP